MRSLYPPGEIQADGIPDAILAGLCVGGLCYVGLLMLQKHLSSKA